MIRIDRSLVALMTALSCVGAYADPPDLWLEAEVSRGPVWLHAQAQYTLRLGQAKAVDKLELSPPRSPLAEIRILGPDLLYERVRDGKRFRVTERRYALFPFSSGTLEFGAAHADLVLPTADPNKDTLRIDAAPQVLKVRAIPEEFAAAHWLPAYDLTLEARLPDPGATLREGVPATLTLRVEARGTLAARLPELDIQADGASIHPRAAKLENRIENGINVGIREQRYEIIPRRSGSITVSIAPLDWWRLGDDRPQQARLPVRTFSVLPAPGDVVPATVVTRSVTVAEASGPATTSDFRPIGVFINLCLLALGIWRLPASKRVRLRFQACQRLRRECRRGNATAARDAVVEWARAYGIASVRSLETIASAMPNEAAAGQLARLERHLYGPADTDWHGEALLVALGLEGFPMIGYWTSGRSSDTPYATLR